MEGEGREGGAGKIVILSTLPLTTKQAKKKNDISKQHSNKFLDRESREKLQFFLEIA